MKRFWIIILLLTLYTIVFSQDTLRITTWNSLKFPANNAQNRIPAFRKVLDSIQPDILIVQELTSENGVDYFKNDILNQNNPGTFYSSPFIDGPDTDNMLFYNKNKLSLLSNRQIQTNLRDFSEYVLEYKSDHNAPRLNVYSIHLKAGDGDRERIIRKNETEQLREILNQLPAGACFFVGGDYNIYTSSEEAYQALIGEQEDNNGQCFDPINTPGNWHNNNNLAITKYHTQSTRTTSVDDGASGGLDDRFDFLLVSKALTDTDGWYCLPETYQSYGNDGRHYNNNINGGTNFAVADSIADALYLASDHLPVCVDFIYNSSTSVTDNIVEIPGTFELLNAYPNPFNSSTVLSYKVNAPGYIQVDIFNIIGQHIETLNSGFQEPGNYTIHYTPEFLNSGVYFVRLSEKNGLSKLQKIVYIK